MIEHINTIVQASISNKYGWYRCQYGCYANAKLIQTFDDVLKIQAEGRAKRLAAENEMAKMENDLKIKLLEISGQ